MPTLPGIGDSPLIDGQVYAISEFGTENVLEASGLDVWLRPFNGSDAQKFTAHFKCAEYGLKNHATGKWIGVNSNNDISCKVDHFQEWESLAFHSTTQGYCVTVHKGGQTGVFKKPGDWLSYDTDYGKRTHLGMHII